MTPGVDGTVKDGAVEAPFTHDDCVTVGGTALTCGIGFTPAGQTGATTNVHVTVPVLAVFRTQVKPPASAGRSSGKPASEVAVIEPAPPAAGTPEVSRYVMWVVVGAVKVGA